MNPCPHCGQAVRAGARFCGGCGKALPVAAVASVVAQPLAQPAMAPQFHLERLLTPGAPLTVLSPLAAEQAVFGYRVARLPDWLSAPETLGQTDAEKLAWVLRTWQQVLSSLWKWKTCAFALRFLSQPQQGAIEMTVLARARPSHDAASVAQAFAADIQAQFAALRLGLQPLSITELSRVRALPGQVFVEVRQHEKLVHLNLGDAYVVHPLRQPAGDFRLLFETLLRTNTPTLLSLLLEPVDLASVERQELAQAAARARTFSDFQYSGQYYQGRWQDPQAALVGAAYTELVRRLDQPFLCAAHIAAAEAPAAWTVARALSDALAAEVLPPQSLQNTEQLPVQCDIVSAQTPQQLAALQLALNQLTFTLWDTVIATPGKERLRYLMDAAGAASLVRFPVPGRSGMAGVQVRQVAPGYGQGAVRSEVAADELAVGAFLTGGAGAVKLSALTRHGLIVGFTGSGKTNTCLYLIEQLWRQHHIPILVIEPAKTEYRGLLTRRGFETTRVFTLGDEAVSPFRLNPFELLPGVRLEAHLSALKTCFNAALPQFGVLPTLVEEALIRIYRDKGWDLTDRPEAQEQRLFPTLRDMYAMIIRVTEERGYAGEVRDNIRAAAAGRIGSLLAGSKGYMFSCQHSIPIDVLLGGPVILELDTLNDNEKALAMMFLLTQLREHCKLNRPDNRLAHITLIEEAHRVLEEVPSVAGSEVAADTRAEAVRFFGGMLAEIRAYGEGILIAEQSPSKLAADAVRNTNLKIAHMLLDSRDREAMAGAMIMDEQQQTFLGKLPVGQAAVFMTGYEKATFVQVPPIKGEGFSERLPETEVLQRMGPFRQTHNAAYLPFDGCRFCGKPCAYRKRIEPLTLDKALHAAFREALLTFDKRTASGDLAHNWDDVARACAAVGIQAGYAGEVDAAYCYLAHEIDFPFTPNMRKQFVAAFQRIGGK